MKSEDFLKGQLIRIDKDLDWTSFDVVNKLRFAIRREFGLRKLKVGHAGTLDPRATGLLIICTGGFTKKINEFMGLDKEYTGLIRLGSTTPSYDLETEVDKHYPTDHISRDLIDQKLVKFRGVIAQKPPAFSAIKKDGLRSYQLARQGEHVDLPSREVEIKTFDIEQREKNDLYFRIVCSKGTYIRSIAHDFGRALDSGAHLAALRRTAIGDHRVEQAMTVSEYLEHLSSSKT